MAFPLLLLVRGRIVRRPIAAADHEVDVTVVIAAFNEERSIGAKLANLIAADWPRDRLQVIVASDGSTDGTNGIVAGFADRGVRLLALPRVGKAAALNAALAEATGEIVIFSDANSMFGRDAIRLNGPPCTTLVLLVASLSMLMNKPLFGNSAACALCRFPQRQLGQSVPSIV